MDPPRKGGSGGRLLPWAPAGRGCHRRSHHIMHSLYHKFLMLWGQAPSDAFTLGDSKCRSASAMYVYFFYWYLFKGKISVFSNYIFRVILFAVLWSSSICVLVLLISFSSKSKSLVKRMQFVLILKPVFIFRGNSWASSSSSRNGHYHFCSI